MTPILNSDELHYAQELRAWRERRGMTKKALADAMVYDPSRVGHIESGRQPATEEFTRQAEAVLQTGGALWTCWEAIAASRFGLSTRPVERDLRTPEFIGWLAEHSFAGFRTLHSSVNAVVARLDAEPPSVRYAREHARRLVTRDQLARAIVDYYTPSHSVGTFYRARAGSVGVLSTSILTQPGWLDTIALGTDSEAFRYVPPPPARRRHHLLDQAAVRAAIHRLASVEVNGTVMVNNPLYRLLDVDLSGGQLSATVTTAPFAEHALTTELMEGELISAIASSTDATPVRDVYLPTAASAFALPERICVGGPVSP